MRIEDLRYKEVVNVLTGRRLGYVYDVEMSLEEGRIQALVVPGPARFFGVLGHEDDYIIPFSCIRKIGDDLIMIEMPAEQRGVRRHGNEKMEEF